MQFHAVSCSLRSCGSYGQYFLVNRNYIRKSLNLIHPNFVTKLEHELLKCSKEIDNEAPTDEVSTTKFTRHPSFHICRTF